jgi:hypothetical protein
MALKKLRCAASLCAAESKRALFEPGTQLIIKKTCWRVWPVAAKRVIFSHFFAALNFCFFFFKKKERQID